MGIKTLEYVKNYICNVFLWIHSFKEPCQEKLGIALTKMLLNTLFQAQINLGLRRDLLTYIKVGPFFFLAFADRLNGHIKILTYFFLKVNNLFFMLVRGVFAVVPIEKGSFVLEYRGDLISQQESFKRQKRYTEKQNSFLFDFEWNRENWWWVAAIYRLKIVVFKLMHYSKPYCTKFWTNARHLKTSCCELKIYFIRITWAIYYP